MQVLGNVSDSDYGKVIPEFQWDRLNSRYQPAYELAKLVLRSTSPDLRRGDSRASAFLVNMNEVFERFVWEALRESLGLTKNTFPHEAKGRKLFLDQRKRIKLEPDLSWWDRGKCVFVGDAKYKKVSVRGIKNPDIYQMFAYTTSANLPSGLLIYAKGEAPSASHSIPSSSAKR